MSPTPEELEATRQEFERMLHEDRYATAADLVDGRTGEHLTPLPAGPDRAGTSADGAAGELLPRRRH